MTAWKRWPVTRRMVAGVVLSGIVTVLLIYASSPISESEMVSIHFPPEVATEKVTDVTQHTVTLHGVLEDLGDAGAIAVSFEWGPDTEYGNETPPQPMISLGTFTFVLENLASKTTYHFQAKALGNGYAYGEDTEFTTL